MQRCNSTDLVVPGPVQSRPSIQEVYKTGFTECTNRLRVTGSKTAQTHTHPLLIDCLYMR